MDNHAEKTIMEEATLGRIRNLVNENKIKLWLAPFYDEETKSPQDDKLMDTAIALSPDLTMDVSDVYQGLYKLQNNALDKLRSRELLTKSAQIEVKLKLDKRAKQQNPGLDTDIRVKVDINCGTGNDLAKQVSEKTNLPMGTFKMISAGLMIKNDIR